MLVHLPEKYDFYKGQRITVPCTSEPNKLQLKDEIQTANSISIEQVDTQVITMKKQMYEERQKLKTICAAYLHHSTKADQLTKFFMGRVNFPFYLSLIEP